jgi:hypothetical protein
MLPPVDARYQRREAYGRLYAAVPGTVIDVPDQDALILEANGWIKVARVGTTAQRPTGTNDPSSPTPGTRYFDIMVGAEIIYDGVSWRSLVDGSAV